MLYLHGPESVPGKGADLSALTNPALATARIFRLQRLRGEAHVICAHRAGSEQQA